MTAPAPTGAQPPGCSAASASRIAGAAGLTFGVLSLIGIASIGHFPKSTQAGSAFVSFITDHRSSILTTNVLLSLANGALLIFFAYLRTLLSAGGRSSTLPLLAFGASVLFCALGAAGAMLPASLAYYGTAGIDPTLVRLLVTAYFATNAFSALPVALAVGAVGLSSARGGILPRWFALASIVVALPQLGATLTLLGAGDFFSPEGDYGTAVLFGSLTIWALAASVLLLARAGRQRRVAAALSD